MFQEYRVEEPLDGNKNPETVGNVDSPCPDTPDTASPHKSRKRTKTRTRVPWTADDYRAHRENKRVKTVPPTELSVGAYAFLFEDIENGLTYLNNVSTPEDYSLPEDNTTHNTTREPEKINGFSSAPSGETTPRIKPGGGGRGALFTGQPSTSPKEDGEEESTPSPEDAIPSRWMWDPRGKEKTTPTDPRGPTPIPSLLVATVSVAEKAKGTSKSDLTPDDLDIHSWKNQTTTVKVSAPMIFKGTYNGIMANILYDQGSGSQIMSKGFAEKNDLRTRKMPIAYRLRYGNSSSSVTDQETEPRTIHIGTLFFKETFLINPHTLPGIDIILGKSFQDRVKCETRYPSQGRVPFGKAFVQFPSGECIYTHDDLLGGTDIDIQYIDSGEAYTFLKEEMRTNRSLEDIEFYKISVQKEAQMNGEIPSPEATVKPIHPDIQKLLDKHDILRTSVPMEEIMARPNQTYHTIPLVEGAEPVKIRPISHSDPKLQTIQALIQELVNTGVVEGTNLNSPWGAPVLLMRKAGNRPGLSNSWRLVCDYRGLNAITKRATWSPPNIRDIMDDLVGCRYFSKTDCVGGFYQLPIHPDDKDKTTFRIRTSNGMEAYRFNVSSLGLQGCPASYQTFMETVVGGLTGVHVYLDDIVYFSKTWEEHLHILDKAFERMAINKVFLHPLKCEFGVEEMEYLGLKLSKNRIQVADDKIAALQTYKVPDSHQALHRFLGFTNYLSAFVKNYAGTVAVLTDLLGGGATRRKFVWTQSCQEAFESIRDGLIKAVGLGIPDKKGDLVLETDASGVGIGACLYQYIDGRLTPLWYLSKKLNSAEQNYSSRDREALAVVYALVKCEGYLLQKPFVLYSDHESLIYLKTQRELKGRDWRWQEIIARYDFEQRYRKGELMIVPDALSRAFDNRAAASGVWDELDHTYESKLHPNVGNLNTKEETSIDVNYIHPCTDKHHADYLGGVDVVEEINILLAQATAWDKLSSSAKKQRGTPPKLRHKKDVGVFTFATRVFGDLSTILKSSFTQDPEFKEIYGLVQQPADSLTQVQKSTCRKYSCVEGLLYYSPTEGETGRLCIPKNQGNGLRMTILYENHDALAHVGGAQKTFDRLRKRYWWPTMHRDCTAYCETCKACKLYASVQKRPEGGMETQSIPEGRWDVVHADWITDLPQTARGHNAILVVHDKITKYAYFIPASKTDTAEEAATKMFAQVFCLHGLPLQLVSDRDKLFTAKFFAQLMRIMNVKQVMGTSYQHNFNGAAERLNRTVEVMLRHVVGDHPDRDFDDYLPFLQWAYNTTKHDSIGMSPFMAQWGYEPRQPLPIADAQPIPNQYISLEGYVEHQQQVLVQVREALLEAKFTMELYTNKQRRNPDSISVGDKVYLSTKNIGKTHVTQTVEKLRKRFIGPYVVKAKRGEYTFELELPKSMKRLHPVFHVSLLWKSEPTPDDLANRFQDDHPLDQNQEDEGPVDPTSLIDENGEALYEVEQIIERKRSGNTFSYLIKWKGYPMEENSWEPKSNILGKAAKQMLQEIDRKSKIAKPTTTVPEKTQPDIVPEASTAEAPALLATMSSK